MVFRGIRGYVVKIPGPLSTESVALRIEGLRDDCDVVTALHTSGRPLAGEEAAARSEYGARRFAEVVNEMHLPQGLLLAHVFSEFHERFVQAVLSGAMT